MAFNQFGTPTKESTTMPKIGIMHSGSPTDGFHDGNINTFISSVQGSYGQDIEIVGPLWAYSDRKLLKDLPAALLKKNVDLIVAAGGSRSAEVAMQATRKQATRKRSRTPVVFTSVAHRVAHQAHLPNNATGVCAHTSDLDGDRLKILVELKPNDKDFGVLVNSNRSDYSSNKKILDDIAKQLGLNKLNYQDINGPTTPKQAFKNLQGIAGVLVAADPFFNDTREELVHLAGTIPTIYQWREFVELGGLMSYGLDIKQAYTEAGKIAASILKNPAIIPPVWEPQQADFKLVINSTAAAKLRIIVPKSLLDRAEVMAV
jgi:putative ABC transport system substrate-binding protein